MQSSVIVNPSVRNPASGPRCQLSVVIVSFNTREVLRRCLKRLDEVASGLTLEIFVVDNASRDGSVEMLKAEFPHVRVFPSQTNLGFGAANNRVIHMATGRYIVLLNSDAFPLPGALQNAIKHMDDEPGTALGGGRLIGEDGSWQPSARMFPSMVNDFLSLSGLASRFPKSRFFGRADRTWADPRQSCKVDWVPGAFSIVRPDALRQVGVLDEAFFLYYEEVDLCRRIKAAGHSVRYWPDVVVVHLGGESAKSLPDMVRSTAGAQLTLWRMRSGFLYYRKHHGSLAWFCYALESGWHRLRAVVNGFRNGKQRQAKAAASRVTVDLLRQAWRETSGGRVSPPRPW